MDSFASAGQRLLDNRASSSHHEGNYLNDKDRSDVAEHEVVHNESTPEPDKAFQRLAVKDAVRQKQMDRLEGEQIVEGLNQKKEGSSVAVKKPFGMQKMTLERSRREYRTNLEAHMAEILSEIEGRTVEFTALKAGTDEDLQEVTGKIDELKLECTTAFAVYKVRADTQIELAKSVAEPTEESVVELLKDFAPNGTHKTADAAARNKVKEPLSEYRQMIASVHKQLKKLELAALPRGKKRAKTDGHQVLAPLLLSLQTDVLEELAEEYVKKEYVCFVSFDSNKSCAVALQSQGITKAHTLIGSCRHIVQLGEWCQKQMKEHKRPFAATAITQKNASKELRRHIVQHGGLSDQILHRICDGGEGVAVYQFELLAHMDKHVTVSWTPFALPEVRVVIAGYELICGFKYEELQGDDYNSKIKALYSMALPAAIELAKRIGFVVIMNEEEPSFNFFPVGYICMTVTTIASVVFRWSLIPSDQDIPMILNLQNSILQTFPETDTKAMQASHAILAASNESG